MGLEVPYAVSDFLRARWFGSFVEFVERSAHGFNDLFTQIIGEIIACLGASLLQVGAELFNGVGLLLFSWHPVQRFKPRFVFLEYLGDGSLEFLGCGLQFLEF